MKDLMISLFQKYLKEFTVKLFNVTYQAGLPDVDGPKPMKFKFYKDKVVVHYMESIRPKSFTILPEDILEVDMVVESVNNTGKVVSGAIAGNLLAGSLGALAMAGSAGNQTKENVLHLVIRYKGENRPLSLQKPKKQYEIYQLLKDLKG